MFIDTPKGLTVIKNNNLMTQRKRKFSILGSSVGWVLRMCVPRNFSAFPVETAATGLKDRSLNHHLPLSNMTVKWTENTNVNLQHINV